jgi:hypothetical protein
MNPIEIVAVAHVSVEDGGELPDRVGLRAARLSMSTIMCVTATQPDGGSMWSSAAKCSFHCSLSLPRSTSGRGEIPQGAAQSSWWLLGLIANVYPPLHLQPLLGGCDVGMIILETSEKIIIVPAPQVYQILRKPAEERRFVVFIATARLMAVARS